jgi:hypothetical protein
LHFVNVSFVRAAVLQVRAKRTQTGFNFDADKAIIVESFEIVVTTGWLSFSRSVWPFIVRSNFVVIFVR